MFAGTDRRQLRNFFALTGRQCQGTLFDPRLLDLLAEWFSPLTGGLDLNGIAEKMDARRSPPWEAQHATQV